MLFDRGFLVCSGPNRLKWTDEMDWHKVCTAQSMSLPKWWPYHPNLHNCFLSYSTSYTRSLIINRSVTAKSRSRSIEIRPVPYANPPIALSVTFFALLNTYRLCENTRQLITKRAQKKPELTQQWRLIRWNAPIITRLISFNSYSTSEFKTTQFFHIIFFFFVCVCL